MWGRLLGWLKLSSISQLLKSFTIKDLLKAQNPSFLRVGERKKQLVRPSIAKTYASTVIYQVPSSKYKDNGKVWDQKILFKDFVVLAKDKEISIEDSIDYALADGDVTVRCNCPSFLFWGFAYIGTQMGYLYGVPKENRSPDIRNPEIKNVICKHLNRVLETISKDRPELSQRFRALYKKVPQPWLKEAEKIEDKPEKSPQEPMPENLPKGKKEAKKAEPAKKEAPKPEPKKETPKPEAKKPEAKEEKEEKESE